MNSKKKFWLSVLSLALVVVIGLSAVGVIIAALSVKVGGSFKVTYTAKHVEAKVTGLKFNDLDFENSVPFGEVTFSNADRESTKELPNIDIDITDNSIGGIYLNAIGYQIENTGKNGFSISATFSGIDENSNIQVIYVVMDPTLGDLSGMLSVSAISDFYLRPSESIKIAVEFAIIDDTKDTNVTGAFNFTLDGLAEEPLLPGYKLNAEIRGGNDSSISDLNQNIQNITFDKYTSEGKYEVSGEDKIAGIEGVNVGGGAMLYRVPNAEYFDVYILSDKTIYFNPLSGCMFTYLFAIQKIEFNNIDTSKVIDMQFMFTCSVESINGIENFDTQNVTNMAFLFTMTSVSSLDLRNWNTENVIGMMRMFYLCSTLETIEFGDKWNTSNVTSMNMMFYSCSSLVSLDISGWDTKNVTDMEQMFYGCSSLTTLDLSGWDTKNVTTMEGMFQDCSSLITLDLSGWNTENVVDMSTMFWMCSKLQTIYAGDGWTTENVSDYSGMFAFCDSLVGGNAENPTHYSSLDDEKEYARIDGENGLPGYLSRKSA